MPTIDCFLLEPTDRTRLFLRRYTKTQNAATEARMCGGRPAYYHQALVPVGEARSVLDPETKCWTRGTVPAVADVIHDERWPTKCADCDYEFCSCADPACVIDAYQVFTDQIYRRADTGEEMALRDAPAGAMWFADWMSTIDRYKGPDGRTLMVRTPGGDWLVDGVAGNCTKPDDVEHRCWVRHGEAPNITVDKDGNTCSAGAGSIGIGGYHGFLRSGQLVD